MKSVMTRRARLLSCYLALTFGAHADIQSESGAPGRFYQKIVKLNAFRLTQAPASAQSLPPAKIEPTDELKLTGIAASSIRKSAYFVLEERGKAPLYFSLTEGGKQGEWEVVAIDVVAETVRLRRQGVDNVLSLKANGVKSGTQIVVDNRKFVDDHTRAHELHQQRERERIEHERALAEVELRTRAPTRQHEIEVSVPDEVEQNVEAQGPPGKPIPKPVYEPKPYYETPR